MIEDIFDSPYTNPFMIGDSDVSSGTPWDDDDAWTDTDVWED